MYNGTHGLIRHIENFEKSGVSLLSYIEKIYLERSKFESPRITSKQIFQNDLPGLLILNCISSMAISASFVSPSFADI